jgi:hypothetical protein
VVLVAVWQDGSVVLCTQIGLTAFAVLACPPVNVFSCLVAADEGDSLDEWLVKDEVYSLRRTVNDVDDTWRESSLLCKLCENHCCTWISLRGLDYNRVTSH